MDENRKQVVEYAGKTFEVEFIIPNEGEIVVEISELNGKRKSPFDRYYEKSLAEYLIRVSFGELDFDYNDC